MSDIRYWDSDAFLALLNDEQGKAESCLRVIAAAEKTGDVVLVTSALTLAEVLWLRDGARISKQKSQRVIDAFEHPYIRVRAVDRWIGQLARDVVWDFEVRPKDAIHVATALRHKVPVLETFDSALIALNGKISRGDHTLEIRTPYVAVQTEFLGESEG